MKKILIFMFGILLLSLVSGQFVYEDNTQRSLPQPIKQYSCGDLISTCANCTFVNVTAVIAPNNRSNILSVPLALTEASGLDGYYSAEFCSNYFIGEYTYITYGDPDGILVTQPVTYEVTSSGRNGYENLIVILFISCFLYIFNLIGFFKGNEIMTILSGMGLMFLGLYLNINGLVIYRDDLTNIFVYVTIGWGFISSMFAAESYMD